MNTTHRPDPEFVGNLEHELRSTIRRQERFHNGASVRASVIRRHRWTTGLVALAAMCIGSAGTAAVTHQVRLHTADLIIARSEAHLEFANARRDFFLEKMQRTESLDANGLISTGEVESMRLELAQVEAVAAARALDVEESQITGREPDDSLSAPLLWGRDFVTERLELRRAVLLQRVALFDEQASRHGLDGSESSKMAAKQEAAQTALSIVEERLALRQGFLSGARTARQVEFAHMQLSVKPQQEMASRRMNEMQQKMDRYNTLDENGLVSRSEVQAVEMEYRAAVLQRELAELEMQILENNLADPSGQ